MPSPVVASWRAYCSCALFILCLLLLTSPTQAANLQVPSEEYATIQAAIDAAAPGDTVLLADGTYTGAGNKNLDFGGKDITVRSASGAPARCIIDCEYSGRGFIFNHGESAAATVDGLTIRHGSVGNSAGGGMYIEGSHPTISRCVFLGNRAYSGGGMGLTSSGPTIINCAFNANSAYNQGGGVYAEGFGDPTLSNPTLTNCTFTANSAYTGGGVSAVALPDMTLINCTFTANSGANAGGALDNWYARITCRNSILWGNHSETSAYNELFNFEEYRWFVSILYPTTLYASDVQGFSASPPDANGNFGADPLFVRAPSPGPDNQWGTEDDDYGDLRLRPGSPCINAGNNNALPTDVTTDLDGNPRIAFGTVDLGAYEVPNLAPTADPQNLALDQDTSLDILLTGSDPENQLLTFTASAPAHGTLSGSGANLTYTPNAGYVGTDTFTFFVTDLYGAVSDTATVSLTVKDTLVPVITLNGANPMSVNQGSAFTDPGATAVDNVDGSVPVSVSGSVNTAVPGSYTLTYAATDAAGNPATRTRTVNVVATAPKIVVTPRAIARIGSVVGVLVRVTNTGTTRANNIRLTSASLIGVEAFLILPNNFGLNAGRSQEVLLTFYPLHRGQQGNLSLSGASSVGEFGLSQSVTIP